MLADDTAGTSGRRDRICMRRRRRPNLFLKIPGTRAGIPAIEESIFGGVPVNITLLFSREQFIAAAEAYMRGIERRIAAGLDPKVNSVASIFVSRWDVAIKDKVPPTCATASGSRLPSAPTRPIATCSTRHAGGNSPLPARGRNACCGPAPAPRVPALRTRCTSRRSRRRTPSTPCPRRRCLPLRSMAKCAASCLPTAAMPRSACCFRTSRGGRCGAGRAASARRRAGFRQVVGQRHGVHRRQGARARQSGRCPAGGRCVSGGTPVSSQTSEKDIRCCTEGRT